jgi:hypothetical protein
MKNTKTLSEAINWHKQMKQAKINKLAYFGDRRSKKPCKPISMSDLTIQSDETPEADWPCIHQQDICFVNSPLQVTMMKMFAIESDGWKNMYSTHMYIDKKGRNQFYATDRRTMLVWNSDDFKYRIQSESMSILPHARRSIRIQINNHKSVFFVIRDDDWLNRILCSRFVVWFSFLTTTLFLLQWFIARQLKFVNVPIRKRVAQVKLEEVSELDYYSVQPKEKTSLFANSSHGKAISDIDIFTVL